jgi:hypothetical protein
MAGQVCTSTAGDWQAGSAWQLLTPSQKMVDPHASTS